MKRKVTKKYGRASRSARKPHNAAPRGERFSLSNPPTTPTLTVKQLAQLAGYGRNQAYEAVRQGIFPAIRVGEKGKIAVLTVPALQILRGERPPGEPGKGDDDPGSTRRPRGSEYRPAAS